MFGKIRGLMGSGSVLGYFLQVLPIACLAGICFLAIRICILKKRGARVSPLTELLRCIFVCYLTGLVSLVILPANFWLFVYDGIFLGWWYGLEGIFRIGNISLVPSIIKWLRGGISIGRWGLTMLIGNVLMFIPLGFFIPLITGIKSRKKMILLAAAIPLFCESVQIFSGRNFDVDDLICNFIGIVIGAVIAFGVLKIWASEE